MGCIAWILGCRVEKTSECFGYVSWHGNFDMIIAVIPVNGQSIVFLSFRVNGYSVILFNGVKEMISVGIGKLFDTKIVNAKAKFSLLCCMLQEACRLFARYIITRRNCLTKFLYQPYIDFWFWCKHTHLWPLFLFVFYRCIMAGWKCFRLILVYYACSIGNSKKKSLSSHDMNCDPFFFIENFNVKNKFSFN